MLQALFSREPETTSNRNIAKGLREPNAGLGSSVRHQVYTELLNCSIISKPFAWSLSKRSLQSGEALEIVQMGSRALRRKNTFWGSPGDHGRLHCGWALKKVSSPRSVGLHHSYNQEGWLCPRLRTHSGCNKTREKRGHLRASYLSNFIYLFTYLFIVCSFSPSLMYKLLEGTGFVLFTREASATETVPDT